MKSKSEYAEKNGIVMDTAFNKQQLRNETKFKLSRLSPEYLASSEEKIISAVLNLDEYNKADTVFCFVSRAHEINTYPLLKDALKKGKRLCVPKCTDTGIMEARQLTDFNELEEADFGLLEPKEACTLILPHEIDFAVIPCMACDMSGRRLGFGGGYYDRYLRQADFFTCVICRQALISDTVPTEEHDIIPGMLITEERIIYTGSSDIRSAHSEPVLKPFFALEVDE